MRSRPPRWERLYAIGTNSTNAQFPVRRVVRSIFCGNYCAVSPADKEAIMIDQEVRAGQIKNDRFPFPSQGDIELGVRNANYALGPVMLHLTMKPGAVIPAHLHKGMAEALYVVEGDFTNEGKQYQPGTSLHFKAGKAHGPHSTK